MPVRRIDAPPYRRGSSYKADRKAVIRNAVLSALLTPAILASAVLVSLAVLPAHASADTAHADAREEAPRFISVIVYGEDGCPKEHDGEIVVCARKPEGERYRIPKALRRVPDTIGSQGWGSTVANMDADARQYIPGSCSVFGSNGQTGCTRAMLHQWNLERQLDQQKSVIP